MKNIFYFYNTFFCKIEILTVIVSKGDFQKIIARGDVKLNCNENVTPGISGQNQNPLGKSTQYEISGKTFIVQTIFKDTSKESIGTLLMKLIKSDCEK